MLYNESKVVLNLSEIRGLESRFPGAVIMEPDRSPSRPPCWMADTVYVEAQGRTTAACLAEAAKAAPLATRVVIERLIDGASRDPFRGLFDAVTKRRVM